MHELQSAVFLCLLTKGEHMSVAVLELSTLGIACRHSCLANRIAQPSEGAWHHHLRNPRITSCRYRRAKAHRNPDARKRLHSCLSPKRVCRHAGHGSACPHGRPLLSFKRNAWPQTCHRQRHLGLFRCHRHFAQAAAPELTLFDGGVDSFFGRR